MSSPSKLDVQRARASFPSLDAGYVFADNAGGSQALKSVADAAYDYLLYSNAQHGATYPTSQRATSRVAYGAETAAVIFNAESTEEVAFGGSSTQLFANLARAMAPLMNEGDELVITGEHEANVGPWKNLAASHNPPLALRTWKPISPVRSNPYAFSYNAAFPALSALVNSRTRVVAISGCSNILGEKLDFKEAVRTIRAKAPNAWIVVDLVAYAPHRSIDVRDWDVDFAVFSYYKLYGPHNGVLYARHAALKALKSIAHFFHSPHYDASPMKLQPGGQGYELAYAASAVLPYLTGLSSDTEPKTREAQRAALERTSKLFEDHERLLAETLLKFLTSDRARTRGVRVVGPEEVGPMRCPTVSFVVLDGETGARALKSRDIVERVDKLGTIGIRFGHFYAYTIVATLPGFGDGPNVRSPDDGVVRISLVHYNTVQEAESIVRALEDILFE